MYVFRFVQILDGDVITARRTAAASATATKVRVVEFIVRHTHAGRQARSHTCTYTYRHTPERAHIRTLHLQFV